MAKLKAKLIIENKEIELPIMEGSMGYPAIDVSSLHSNAIKTEEKVSCCTEVTQSNN